MGQGVAVAVGVFQSVDSVVLTQSQLQQGERLLCIGDHGIDDRKGWMTAEISRYSESMLQDDLK